MQLTQLSWSSRMTTHYMGLILVRILLTSLAAVQSTLSQATSFLAAGTYSLTVTERELSLDAREASLAAILAEIGQQTGIPIVTIAPGVDERISIHLSQMPLQKALKQLAPSVAIAKAQGPNAPPHRIAKVYVLPKGRTSLQVEESAAGGPFLFTFAPSQH